MRAGNAARRRQQAAQRAAQQDDAATAVSDDALQPTAGAEQPGETPDPGTQAHTNDGERPEGMPNPGDQVQQPPPDQPGAQQGQESSPPTGKRRQSRSSGSSDESPPAKKRKSNKETRKDDEQNDGLQTDAPEVTETACEKLARLIKEKTDQASAANLPPLVQGPHHHAQLDELAIWRAIASVTEAISRNPTGPDFSLVDPDNFRWARAGSDMPNTVFRAGNEAFLPRTEEKEDEQRRRRGHSSLFYLRRDQEGQFSIRHYDSAHGPGHRQERHAYGGSLRNGLTRIGWNTGGLTIPEIRDSGNIIRQRDGWECGFYTTIFAWALACGIDIAQPRSVPTGKYGAFLRDMVVLVQLAMRGFLNSDTLEAFFHCYGLLASEERIPDERRFANTVPLPLASSLNTRVSLQIELEIYAQANGLSQPLDLDTILEVIADPHINLATYDVDRLLRAYRRALGDDQVTPSPRRPSPQEPQPGDNTTEQPAGFAGITQDDIDIDRAVRAGQEQERNRTSLDRDQDRQRPSGEPRQSNANDDNDSEGDNDDDGPPDVPGAGAAKRQSAAQEEMTDREREQRQTDFNRTNNAIRNLLAERGDALAPGGIRELIAELPEQILVPPEHLLIRYEMSSWWYDLLQNWRAFRAAHLPEGTALTEQHVASFLREQAERERHGLVESGRIAAERSFPDGTDDYTDLQRAQIGWLETHLASARMMVAERNIRETSTTDHSYFEQAMMRITPGGADPLGLTEDEERTVHGIQSAFRNSYNDGDARIDDPALQERWDDVRRTLQDVFRARRDAIRVGIPVDELESVESTLAQRDDALEQDPEAHVRNLLEAWQRLIRVHANASLRTEDARNAAREQFRSSLLQDENEQESAEAPENGTPQPPRAQFDQISRYVKFNDSAPATVQERRDVEELQGLRRTAPGLARRWEDDRRNQGTEPTETNEGNAETGTEQQQQQQQQAQPTSQNEELVGEEDENEPGVGAGPGPNEGLGSSQRSHSTPRSSEPPSPQSSSDSSSDSSHGQNPNPQTQQQQPPPPPPPVTPPPASNNGRYYNQQSPSTGFNPPSPNNGNGSADGSRTPDFYGDGTQGGSGDSLAQGPHTPRGTSPSYSPTSPIYDDPDRSSPDYGANQNQQEEPRVEGTHTPRAPSLNYSPTSPNYRPGPGDYAPMSPDYRPRSPDYNVSEPYRPDYGATQPEQGGSSTQERAPDDFYNSPSWRATSCVPVSESPPARNTPYSPLRSPLTAYDRGEHISPRASGASERVSQTGQGGGADDPIHISSSPLSSSPLQSGSPDHGQRVTGSGSNAAPNNGVRSNGQGGAIMGTASPVYSAASPIYDYEDEENSADPAPSIRERSVRRDTASSLPDPPNSSAVPDLEQVEQEDHDSLFGDDNSDPEDNENENAPSSSPQAEPLSTPTPAPRLPGLTLPPRNPGPPSAFLVSSVPAEIVPPLPQFQVFPGSMSPKCRKRSWEMYEEGLMKDEVRDCERSPKRLAVSEVLPEIVVEDVGRSMTVEDEQVVERPVARELEVSVAAEGGVSDSVSHRGNLIDVFTGERVGLQPEALAEDDAESERRSSVSRASETRRLSHPHHHRRA